MELEEKHTYNFRNIPQQSVAKRRRDCPFGRDGKIEFTFKSLLKQYPNHTELSVSCTHEKKCDRGVSILFESAEHIKEDPYLLKSDDTLSLEVPLVCRG